MISALGRYFLFMIFSLIQDPPAGLPFRKPGGWWLMFCHKHKGDADIKSSVLVLKNNTFDAFILTIIIAEV